MNRLKELRKEKGVSLAKLGEELGMAQTSLTNYENEKRQPRDMEVWERLADYFDVIPEYLLGYTTIRTKEEREMCERCVEYWRWREKR
ncbi:helix-turn-helix domain-containing protein [Enterococcus cecorum]|uniref:helix-turn-helix domain-containing protein n=1 Tax=Enterococcus cecorum TaxID=44008 RepID=UPI0009B9CA89|nr:helix-turn-helix transcriptional regulator [Enterococcus cecorum]